jgi:hypothetical protein
MIEAIFVVFGLVMFTDAMFVKFDIWSDFLQYAQNAPFKWMFELFTCRFCVLFHIGWMWTIVFGIMGSFSWPLLIVPFIVGGFIHLIGNNDL